MTTGTDNITDIIIWKDLSAFEGSIKLLTNVQSHQRVDDVIMSHVHS